MVLFSEIEDRLNRHHRIAFDFDECLFQGLYSYSFFEFIKNNKGKEFSIVTNRPLSLEPDTMAELYILLDNHGIEKSTFKHIIHSPDLDLCGSEINPDFKMIACRDIKCTLLIDDDEIHGISSSDFNVEFLKIPAHANTYEMYGGWA